MNASLGDVVGVSGWTTGSKNQNRQGGSWQDAHDGVLEKVSTSFGSIDGVISIHQPRLAPQSSETFYTWLASGRDQHEVRFLNFIVSHRKPQYFIDRTASYWQAWVNKEDIDFCDLPEHVVKLYKQSLLITRTHVDENGGIVAGNDSDFTAVANGFESYSYVWPRDGAYIANALDKAGYAFLSARFYEFCADVIYRGQNIRDYQEVYDETAYMLHKYTPDRLAASNWMPLIDEHGNHHLPIQEDGTALIPYCLWQHYLKFRDIESIKPWFRPLIIQTANFLVKFRDPVTKLPSPSFDLWEERRAVYSYTSSTVWAGLNASANFADMFGELEEARKFRQAAAEIKQACETYLYDEDQGRFLKSVFVAEDGELIKDYTIDASHPPR